MNDSPDHRDVGEVSTRSTSASSCTATATATPNGSWQQLSVTRTLASGHDSNTHLDLNPCVTGGLSKRCGAGGSPARTDRYSYPVGSTDSPNFTVERLAVSSGGSSVRSGVCP